MLRKAAQKMNYIKDIQGFSFLPPLSREELIGREQGEEG